MKSVIMYNGNMPVQVPLSHIKDYLRRGYTHEAKIIVSVPPVYAPLKSVEIDPKLDSLETPENLQQIADVAATLFIPAIENGIKINSEEVGLKDLIGSLKLSTAVAKKVVENRPYAKIEELIEKVPSVDWTIYSNIDYAQ